MKRQCLFDVSIGALSEPESCEENIDWINNCDRDYGIMCLGMSPNIYHLIDSAEYPFELWNNFDKAFGVHEVEDEAWSEPIISYFSLSQYFLAYTFSDEVYHDEEVSHIVHVAATLLIRMLPPSMKKQILKSRLFLCLLKVIFLLVILMLKKK